MGPTTIFDRPSGSRRGAPPWPLPGLYAAGKSFGRADIQPVCVAVKAPSFNATALGGHILFHTTAIDALANLAIAQIAYAKDLRRYLDYQIRLAAHVLARRPVSQWPVPGCPKGDPTCREKKLQGDKVQARRKGLLVAILGHELGHLIHHHAASDYEASTGDPLMGPQPMDIVYVALFIQALSDAMKKLTRKELRPALLRSHPASHARADRSLRIIVANRYAGHELAKNAYQMLIAP